MPSFSVQKAVFCRLKDGILQDTENQIVRQTLKCKDNFTAEQKNDISRDGKRIIKQKSR